MQQGPGAAAEGDLLLEEARAFPGVGYTHRVRDWWAARGFGDGLREKYLLGANKDGTAAIIPFWHRGRIKGFIRRPLAASQPSTSIRPLRSS
jgi:hypothetical protein